MIGIVVSRADSASVHLGEHLLDLADWDERVDDARTDSDGGGTYHVTDGFQLRFFDDLHLDLVRPADAFDDPAMLVFASRHAGDTGALLTGHFTGNLGPADYGGEDGALAAACPNALARLLEAFDEHAPSGYDVGMECTHHGPSEVGAPSLFAELGSTEEQWDDPEGARAVARAILDLRGVEPHRERQFVGLGGGHYVPRFERIVRETPWAVGHVAADWGLEAMGGPVEHEDVIDRLFAASRARHAVVDGDHPSLERVVEDLGYRVASETWVRAVGTRPLDLVERLEAAIRPVDEGLRFGRREDEDVSVVDLPAELVATANGIDRDRTRQAVADHAVAFETEEGGSLVRGRAAVPSGGDEALVDALVDVLRERYDAVERNAGEVIARERAFDPDRARDLGVPEGPLFGTLAAGESVTVEGETIEPTDVTVTRTDRFSV